TCPTTNDAMQQRTNREASSNTTVAFDGDSTGTSVALNGRAKVGTMNVDATTSSHAVDNSGRRRALHGVALMAIIAGIAGSGCAFKAPSGRATPEMSALVVEHQPYRIRVGDALDVRFYKTPELNVEK